MTRLLPLLLGLAISAPAASESADKAARAAAEERLPAVTVYVDVTWGNRTAGAARALTASHQAFAAHGYRLVNVEGYSENGDLQGFFVSYQRAAAVN